MPDGPVPERPGGGPGGPAAGQCVEGEGQVQASRGAVHAGPGEMGGDRVDHGVTAADVAPAQDPQVAFQLARAHQLGQHELRQDGVTQVGVALGGHQRVVISRRGQDPPDPKRGREELGDAAGVTDLPGKRRVQRGDRRPVIAVLGVVVVLDDQAAVAGPLMEVAAPGAVEDHAHGELVRGSEHDRPGPAGAQLVDLQAALIDRDRQRVHLPALQLLPGPERPGVLHRDRRQPGRVERPGQQGQGLGHAGDDDHLVRGHPDAAVAGQPVRDREPEGPGAARIPVPET